MTKDDWRALVIRAVKEADGGKPEFLDLLVQNLFEMDLAKQLLRIKGYGWLGLSLLLTILEEVPSCFENEQEVQEFIRRQNASPAAPC